MMTLDDYRQHVYDHFELEPDDLKSSLIDRWVQEGFDRIVRATPRLPFFDTKGVIQTAGGVADYELPFDARSVTAVTGPWGIIGWLEPGEAQAKFGNSWSPVSTTVPVGFSVADQTITFWPAPSGVDQVNVFGVRRAQDWISGGAAASPDFPPECESILLSWVMYRAYSWDGDLEDANRERQEFDAAVAEVLGSLAEPSVAPPMILGGGPRASRSPGYISYPFEAVGY